MWQRERGYSRGERGWRERVWHWREREVGGGGRGKTKINDWVMEPRCLGTLVILKAVPSI